MAKKTAVVVDDEAPKAPKAKKAQVKEVAEGISDLLSAADKVSDLEAQLAEARDQIKVQETQIEILQKDLKKARQVSGYTEDDEALLQGIQAKVTFERSFKTGAFSVVIRGGGRNRAFVKGTTFSEAVMALRKAKQGR